METPSNKSNIRSGGSPNSSAENSSVYYSFTDSTVNNSTAKDNLALEHQDENNSTLEAEEDVEIPDYPLSPLRPLGNITHLQQNSSTPNKAYKVPQSGLMAANRLTASADNNKSKEIADANKENTETANQSTEETSTLSLGDLTLNSLSNVQLEQQKMDTDNGNGTKLPAPEQITNEYSPGNSAPSSTSLDDTDQGSQCNGPGSLEKMLQRILSQREKEEAVGGPAMSKILLNTTDRKEIEKPNIVVTYDDGSVTARKTTTAIEDDFTYPQNYYEIQKTISDLKANAIRNALNEKRQLAPRVEAQDGELPSAGNRKFKNRDVNSLPSILESYEETPVGARASVSKTDTKIRSLNEVKQEEKVQPNKKVPAQKTFPEQKTNIKEVNVMRETLVQAEELAAATEAAEFGKTTNDRSSHDAKKDKIVKSLILEEFLASSLHTNELKNTNISRSNDVNDEKKVMPAKLQPGKEVSDAVNADKPTELAQADKFTASAETAEPINLSKIIRSKGINEGGEEVRPAVFEEVEESSAPADAAEPTTSTKMSSSSDVNKQVFGRQTSSAQSGVPKSKARTSLLPACSKPLLPKSSDIIPRPRQSLAPMKGFSTKGRISYVPSTKLPVLLKRTESSTHSMPPPTAPATRLSLRPSAPLQYPCKECPARFNVKALLDAHSYSHMGSSQSLSNTLKRQSSSSSLVVSGVNQCKYCDKKFQIERALHIHLMQHCTKIPSKEKRKLGFSELNHVEKAKLPAFDKPKSQIPKPTNSETKTTAKAVQLIATDSNLMPPPNSAKKSRASAAHSGVVRTPTKSIVCGICKKSFTTILDYTNHCLSMHSTKLNTSSTSAEEQQLQ